MTGVDRLPLIPGVVLTLVLIPLVLAGGALADTPVITAPPDQTVEATSPAGAVVSYADPAVTHDGAFTVGCAPASGSTFPLGATTVTCTATDTLTSEAATATFSVTVRDTTAPTLTIPSALGVQTTVAGGVAVTYSASALDAVSGGVPVTCSPPSGSLFPVGATTVNCSAADAAGNTANGSFVVTVTLVDGTPPVVTVPGPISETTSSPSGKVVTFTASATDETDGARPVDCTPPSGSTFPVGTTTVTCTASDTAGNTGSASFTVTITLVDTTAPVVSVPANISETTSSPSGKAVSFSASATDDVDGALTPSCAPASGALFTVGTTTVTCTATDAAGNTGTGSFTVTVVLVDTTPPVVTVPADISQTTTVSEGLAVNFVATATDDVTASVAVLCAPQSGSVFPVGTTTVTCTASDASGNTGSASFTVTITLVDTTPPVVTVPGNVTQTTPVPTGSVVTWGGVSANDNIDGSRPVACSPESGSQFAVGQTTVTCTATDTRGNTGSASFVVTVTLVDTTAPVVTVPAPVSAEATGPDGAGVTFSASADDNLDGSVATVCTPASGSKFPLGTTQVSCRATDTRGNAGTATFTVTIVDTKGPAVTMPPDIRVEANSPSGASASYVVMAVDLVDGPLVPGAIRCEPGPGARFGLGVTVVRCTATDLRGNSTVGRMTVSVVDTTPPVVTAPAPLTLVGSADGLPASDARIAAFLAGARAADIVDERPTVSSDAPSRFPFGRTVVTFAAADSSGNRSTATSSVTIQAAPQATPAAAVDRVAPDNVAALRAESGNGKVRLRWRRPRAPDFDHVEVFSSLNVAGAEESRVFRGSATTFVAKRLANGTEYRFVVVSFDRANNRSAGVAIVATPKATPLISPLQGARLTRPPLFAWVRAVGADYYNLQLFRGTRKVLSVWPRGTRFKLPARWKHSGRTERLRLGTYQWYVWPAFASAGGVRYGALHGRGTFMVGR